MKKTSVTVMSQEQQHTSKHTSKSTSTPPTSKSSLTTGLASGLASGLISISAVLLLASCSKFGFGNKKPAADQAAVSTPIVSNCSDATAIASLTKKYTDTINTQSGVLTANGVDSLSAAGALAQLKPTLSDIRTDKEEGNKSTCEASLTINIPTGTLESYDKALSKNPKMPNIRSRITSAGFNLSNTALSKTVSYTVTPTDDKKNLVVDTNMNNGIDTAVTDIAAALVLNVKGSTPQNATAATAAAAAPANGQGIIPTTVNAAPAASNGQGIIPTTAAATDNAAQQADLNQASTAYGRALVLNKSARRDINSAWNSLPAEIKSENIAEQRAWVKRKKASCGNVSVGGDINMNNIAVVRAATRTLTCDTNMTLERMREW